MSKKKVLLSVLVLIIFTFIGELIVNTGYATKYKYVYNGREAYGGGRGAVIKFNVTGNVVRGELVISPVCGHNIKMAGGKLHFTAYLRGTRARGKYNGYTITCKGRKGANTYGTIIIGYHPYYKLYVRLYRGHKTKGGVEYRFNCPTNPFK